MPPTGCGTAEAPWHRVLLKHPGGVPAGAGGDGGPIGEFAPSKWHWAHTEAFSSAVLVWTYVSPERQAAGWGDWPGPPWQPALRQDTCAPPPEKSSAWQIWQETNPELPGTAFADDPCPWGGPEGNTTQFGSGSWWHAERKQDWVEIPPVRSLPWHCVH